MVVWPRGASPLRRAMLCPSHRDVATARGALLYHWPPPACVFVRHGPKGESSTDDEAQRAGVMGSNSIMETQLSPGLISSRQ